MESNKQTKIVVEVLIVFGKSVLTGLVYALLLKVWRVSL